MNGQRELRNSIQQKLDHDPRLRGSTVRVSIRKGVATLTGTVPAASLKPVAQALTLQVEGVTDVVNNLGVGSPETGVDITVPRRITGGDAELAQAVRDALSLDEDLRHLPITTTVVRTRVTLTGIVERWQQSDAAMQRVRGVDGVSEVVNQLVPRALHDLVAAARTGGGDGAGDDQLHLTVHDRTVTVEGIVRSWDEKQAVLEALGESGATYGILDRVRVEPTP